MGEAIALVVADKRYIAEDALALIEMDIQELPAASDCRDALSASAPDVHVHRKGNLLIDFVQGYGDADAAVEAAPRRLTVNLKQHRGGAHPIEGRGLVASFDAASDLLTVWSSTQLAHEARYFIMKMLGLDENRIRVVTPDVGGGFGAKFILYPEEVAISAASMLLRRPVKWIEDRREHFMASIQERDQYWDVEVGIDDDGRLLGARGTMISDAGAYTYQGINLHYNASTNFPGPYVLPHYKLHVSVVETNKVPTAPVRGAGYPEGCFAMERVIDAIARDRGLDRVEVRRRNLVPANAIPYTTPMQARSTSAIVYESGDFPACLDLALSSADYAGFPARREQGAGGRTAPRVRHRHRAQRHRPRPVRVGHRPGWPLREGLDLHRRHGDGAGLEDRARANRRRSDRRSSGRHHGGQRRHLHHPTGARRLCQPPDGDRRELRASGGSRRAREGDRGRGAHARSAGGQPGHPRWHRLSRSTKIFQSRCATSPTHWPVRPATRCRRGWRRGWNPR